MAIDSEVVDFVDYFNRAQALTTTPGQNGWTGRKTGTGTPTYLCVTEDGGALEMTLSNTSEAQVASVTLNDVLPYDLRQLQRFEFVAKVASINSVTTLLMGLGTAQNDTADNVATNCWFRIEGSASTSAVVFETDDATTDRDDVATGFTLSSTYKRFVIDLTNGISDIGISIDGQPIATRFSLSAVAAGQNVQPYFQLQKASGTGTPQITIAKVRCVFRKVLGS